MAKRKMNKRKWIADLYEFNDSAVDENDRPKPGYNLKRKLFYASKGVTSNEKYLSRQDKREVVKRISIVMDRSITETGNRIKILDTMYQITRIYLDEDNQEMELSLAYVD